MFFVPCSTQFTTSNYRMSWQDALGEQTNHHIHIPSKSSFGIQLHPQVWRFPRSSHARDLVGHHRRSLHRAAAKRLQFGAEANPGECASYHQSCEDVAGFNVNPKETKSDLTVLGCFWKKRVTVYSVLNGTKHLIIKHGTPGSLAEDPHLCNQGILFPSWKPTAWSTYMAWRIVQRCCR